MVCRSARLSFLSIMVGALAAFSGCHSRITPLGTPSDMAHAGAGADMSVADMSGLVDAALPPVDMACTPQYTNCAGLCGPVTDSCTGKTLQCGTCSGGQVCDLVAHQCVTPVTACAPTQCGKIRNSCGARLTCSDCPAGQQCNPDTNSCETCVQPTCQQMGFQCGKAWLGCGSQTANLTDCGSCPAGSTPVCNPTFNQCEPACTPASTQTLCDAAHAATGVQCGVISDGCGGSVDCSNVPAYKCAAGFACGAQGDANRCEPFEAPTECIAAGKNCGTIKSVCTNQDISCGTCTAPQVCNANGVCGAPCKPKACGDLSSPPQCGTVDDGCGGQLKCGDCPDSTYVCLGNNTCCEPKTCAKDYAGQCGTALDNGCGSTIDCSCASGSCQATTPGTAGSCCVNTASCAANSCNTSYTDTCTGQVVQCSCGANQWCDTSSNSCKSSLTCAQEPGTNNHAPGKPGDACSNGGAFDSGGGNLISCPCTQGEYCISGTAPSGTVVTGTNKGTCCQDTACDGTHCGSSGFTNSCTGVAEACGCKSGFYCGSGGTCVADNTCATYMANGQVGQQCSNGGAFDNGAGGKIKCPCASGEECIVSGSPNKVASGSQIGMCCAPTKQSCGNNCNTTVVPDSCIGTVQTCSCNASTSYCDSGTNTCDALKTCGDYSANGNIGNVCGSEPNGNGGTLSCPCSTVNGKANNKCVGGVCTCTPIACSSCGQTGQSDGCGGTLSCGNLCGGGTVCYPSGGGATAQGCCTPASCSALPAGVPPNDSTAMVPAEHPSCGTYDDGCGQSFSCGCPANNPVTGNPWSAQCVAKSGTTPPYGFCECTPHGCVGVGAGQDDGCGHPLVCNG